jgi:hypothetical protein
VRECGKAVGEDGETKGIEKLLIILCKFPLITCGIIAII